MKPQPVIVCSLHLTDSSFGFVSPARMLILKLLLAGNEIPEIAAILKLSEGTVQNEIEAMAHRLNCSGKFAFLLRILKCGFIEMRFSSQPPVVFTNAKKVKTVLDSNECSYTVNANNSNLKFIYTIT